MRNYRSSAKRCAPYSKMGCFTILRKLLSQVLNSFSKAASASVTLVSAQGRLAKTNDKSSDDATSADDCATLTCQAFTLGRDFFRNHLFTCAFSASTFRVTRELNFFTYYLLSFFHLLKTGRDLNRTHRQRYDRFFLWHSRHTKNARVSSWKILEKKCGSFVAEITPR